MSYLEAVSLRMRQLDAQVLLREIPEPLEGPRLDFSSNDYLGLSEHPAVLATMRDTTRAGSGGSRLLAGALGEHRLLEDELAAFLGRERALLFSSGYLAALGAISALAPFFDLAYSDTLNHACLIDGLRLTKLERRLFTHGNLPATDARRPRAVIVSETIFGMDGDAIDPTELIQQLGEDDVLILDEAHALGVAGSGGAGLAAGIDDPRIVIVGTLSKAFGLQGGFVAGPDVVIRYLVTAARSFMYDTALPPGIARAARAALRLVRAANEARSRLTELRERLVGRLRADGVPAHDAIGAVVSIAVGDAGEALRLAAALRTNAIVVPAIRPPTVPPGTSRLRVSLRATHLLGDIERLATAVLEARG